LPHIHRILYYITKVFYFKAISSISFQKTAIFANRVNIFVKYLVILTNSSPRGIKNATLGCIRLTFIFFRRIIGLQAESKYFHYLDF